MCAAPKPRLPDAAAEGWGSETLAEAAQQAIKKLLAPCIDPAEAPPAVSGRFALTPARLGPLKSPGGLVVHRGEAAALPERTSPWAEALRPLRARFRAATSLHVKVKTIKVAPAAPDTKRWQTTHLVHFDGPAAAGGRLEANATWEATWRARPDGSPALIESIRCAAWEDAASAGEATWFTDRTADVLRESPDVAAQCRVGNPGWRLRLQASLPFFKFGHHGLSIADVNGDGLDDVYVCQPGGLPNRLLLHRPDGSVMDAAAAWGVDLLDSSQCALFADFDNDGDPDLVVATAGPLAFFENTGRAFVPRLRLPPVLHVHGLAAADFDTDGDLDLYAVRYFPSASEGGELAVPVPQFDANNGGPNFLIRNDGPAAGEGWRRFTDATAATGLDAANRRFSYAAVWDDLNNDGLPDIYVANDFGRNNLFMQSRQADGSPRFTDVADAAGLSSGAFGMSAATGDVNRDGWPDIHLGAMFSSAGSRITASDRFRPGVPDAIRERFRRLARGNALFLNKGTTPLAFDDISVTAGITVGRWSWASLFADIDNDAWPDLLVANGFITGQIPDDL